MRFVVSLIVIALTMLPGLAATAAPEMNRSTASERSIQTPTPAPLAGPCPFAPQPNIPSSDTVWIEDSWSPWPRPIPPPEDDRAYVWEVDSSQYASGTASFPVWTPPDASTQELFAQFDESRPIQSRQTFVVYVLLSTCDPAPTSIGVELSLGGPFVRYYWGDTWPDSGLPEFVQTPRGIAPASLPELPVRMGDLPPAGQWVRLEIPLEVDDPASRWIESVGLRSAAGRLWWDHVGIASTGPTLTAVVPAYGAASGGTPVRLLGTGFVDGPMTVRFGSAPATSVAFVSSTEITATASAGAGTVDVEVTTSTGASVLADAFTFVAAPTLTEVSPSKLPVSANQTVVLHGTNFVEDETTVSFGSVAASSVNVISATRVEAVAPAQGAGIVDIYVTTPGGVASLTAAFSYLGVPIIQGVSPAEGSVGTAIEIAGQGFDVDASGNVVSIGGVVAPVVSASATRLVASVPAGAATGRVTVTTAGGTATSAADFVVILYDHIVVLPASASVFVGETTTLSAAGVLADGSTQTLTTGISWTSANGSIASVDTNGVVLGVSPGTAIITATTGAFSASATITVANAPPLPPDPANVATPLSTTELTSFADSTSFLYSGPQPIQTGVAPGTIEQLRASVTRGVVRTREGTPLGGVKVRILDHAECGQTLTRADGMYDLVVNGGTTYVVVFEKSGYISAQRHVYARWQDFSVVEDVVMIRYDVAATTMTAGSSAPQIARASVVTDAEGERRATLFMAAGTSASMTLPDGTTSALDRVTVRMTEYTVGPNGPRAMPAELPPQTAYTYCVELSADEAVAAGAVNVTFNRPLAFYLENFIRFPAGGTVPSGYYDRQRGAWVASTNGRVLAITSITGGTASIDVDGDGIADATDTLAQLGIDNAERAELARIYSAGVSLWRIPIEHFTPYDPNWPLGFDETYDGGPSDEMLDPSEAPQWGETTDDSMKCAGSVVRCENQTLGEEIAITGTPFSLVYESGRVIGRVAERTFRLEAGGPTTPRGVGLITTRVTIGGRVFEESFSPSSRRVLDFAWDGRDVYGRIATGVLEARVKVTYAYPAVYLQPRASALAFSQLSGIPFPGPIVARNAAYRSSEWSVPLGGLRAEQANLGGWTLSPHHLYDFTRRTLLLGNGEQRSADGRDLQKFEMSTAAGTRVSGTGDQSGVATRTALNSPYQIAVGPDGSIYTNEWSVIRRIRPSGAVERIAGTGTKGFNGDGPATSVRINANSSISIAPDGSLYFPDRNNYRVRRIKDGQVTTVAGNGQYPDALYPLEENVPATAARLNPADVVVASDGTLYIADRYRYIRKVTPDGMIQTVAGGGTERSDGTPATRFKFNNDLEGLAIAPDGTLYFAEEGSYGAVLRKIGTDGVVRTVIPTGLHCTSGTIPHDGPAYGACLDKVWFLRVGPDGTVYIPDQIGSRLRVLTPDGQVRTVGGNGTWRSRSQLSDRGIATGEAISSPSGVDVGPDGTIYVTDVVPELIRKIVPALPRFSIGETVIPSSDGNMLYVFAGSRHLRTLDALSGAVLLAFTYDSAGRLTGMQDVDGKVTAIERNAAGDPIAVVASGGQRTTIEVDSNGYLKRVTDPAGKAFALVHDDTGLLTELTTPRQLTHQYTFDENGRLLNDTAPDGHSLTLTRSDTGDSGWRVTTTTTLGKATTIDRQRQVDGAMRQLSVLSSGARVDITSLPSGTKTLLSPEGLLVTTTVKADPRFGTSVPLQDTQIRFPSGRILSLTRIRTVTLGNPADMLSLQTQTDKFTINGRSITAVYDNAARETKLTTPFGRTATFRADISGRPVHIELPGLAPIAFGYTEGLLTSHTWSTRTYSFGYDTRRRLTSMTNPLQQNIGFSYDDADRLVSQTLPDGRFVSFQFDADGNLTSVTPPSRPSHTFSFTGGGQIGSYTAPVAALTRYQYDADRKLKNVIRPDGSTVTFSRDTAGRLVRIEAPDASLLLAWDSSGRIERQTSTDGSLIYSYDGTVLTGVTSSGPMPATVTYAYDGALRLESETVNGSTITFGWDNDDLLIQAGALSLTRHASNGLLTATNLGMFSDAFSYDERGDLASYSAAHEGASLYSVTYARDAIGRIASRTEVILGSTYASEYEYDSSGRLETVKSGGVALHEYAYDDNSNRTVHRWLGGSATGQYDAQDRLLEYDGATYAYTLNGDLRSVTLGGATTTYLYDVFGNLRNVALPGDMTIEYVHDAQNRRVAKKLNSALVQGWVYSDGLRISAELDGAGAIVSRFVYGSRANVPDYMIRGGAIYRILSDHVGSPRLVVSTTNGIVAQRLDYDEFGNVLSDTNPGFQPFGFAGGLYDRDTRLVRFGARDYDPRTGRWTAKDPILFDAGDTNLYGYTWNDPVNWIDPSGLSGFCAFGRVPPWVRTATDVAHAARARGLPRATPPPRLRPANTNRPGQPPNPGSGPTEPTPVQKPSTPQRWVMGAKEGAEAIDEASSFIKLLETLGSIFPFLSKPSDFEQSAEPMCDLCA